MRSPFTKLLPLFLILLTSCALNSRVRGLESNAPFDFSLDITVVTTELHMLAHMRSSRYVIFPDGSIHYSDKEGWGPNTLPPRTRILSRSQLSTIWSRLKQMGMGDS